jgi:hypothetical protein
VLTLHHSSEWIKRNRSKLPEISRNLGVDPEVWDYATCLKPDSSARDEDKGLSDNAFGNLVPCHAPWLSLETDIGGGRRSCRTAVGTMGLTFTGYGALL